MKKTQQHLNAPPNLTITEVEKAHPSDHPDPSAVMVALSERMAEADRAVDAALYDLASAITIALKLDFDDETLEEMEEAEDRLVVIIEEVKGITYRLCELV